MRGTVLRILGFLIFILLAYFASFFGLSLLLDQLVLTDVSDDPGPDDFLVLPESGAGTAAASHPGLTVIDTAVLAAFLSLIASGFSLIGFISATLLAWRKEKRDVASYAIDRTKKELEIAKLKLDLEHLSARRDAEIVSAAILSAEVYAERKSVSSGGEPVSPQGVSTAGVAPNTGPQTDGSAAA